MTDSSTPVQPVPADPAAPSAFRPFPARAWPDVAIISVLSLLGVIGYETSFGDYNFLVAGIGGLVVGTGFGVLGYVLRLGVVTNVLVALLGYFLFGSALTMPAQSIFGVIPSLETLAGLALGAVWGWTDIVTLQTPVEAPYYIPVVPYFATWLVALVGTMLASRWLVVRRSPLRSSVLLIGPVLLFLSGILLGTDETYFAGVRGVAFAAIALIWLGWRRNAAPAASDSGASRLQRRKLAGTGMLVTGAVLVGALAGTALAPTQPDRFVLREEITPPFDPLAFPSPLAGFRSYTKDLSETTLFTATGLEPGDVIRLASMDSYDGRLWNVAGPDDMASSDGGFELVGETLPLPGLMRPGGERTAEIEIAGYDDVWLPGVGYPTRLRFDDAESVASAGDLRYNSSTGTAVLTSGVEEEYRYTIDATLQKGVDDDDLIDTPAAQIDLAPVENTPDVVVAKAQEFAGGAESPIEQLRAIETALKTQGFLSHGLASDSVPSRAGHGADRMIELFTRSQMVGDEEQYASAMALMARYLGYPARVVMGFAPEVGEDADSVEVVGDDVTAWVEVAFEDVGWVAFHPTPDETDIPQDQTPKPKSEPQPQVRQPPRSDNEDEDLLTAVEIDDSDDEKKNQPFAIPLWAWVTAGVIGIPLLLVFGAMLVVAAIKARRRNRRRNRGSGDRRVAGAWDEMTDEFAELGFDVPRVGSRRQVAAVIERQLHQQGLGDARGGRTDTGPVRIVRADGPASGIRVMPLADATDRAVFGGQEIEQSVVDESWDTALESVGLARAASGRLRRLFSRFRIRSKRDWGQVDISGAKSSKSAKPAKPAKPPKPSRPSKPTEPGGAEAAAPAAG
ncbi:transglutaminase domain-containing protein [Agromyces fucosus]|uniref:Transglutaminase domain-containing protein n=1 Tax=Agromyces fucosus TaxID=41985 RepID=A0A4Q2JUC2_9MICO|nr:transglutaminase domain-containing protein [Agromyces fucosus]RXZ50904.1 transglutaminase domain-containing protein [Agromyces fucosus]